MEQEPRPMLLVVSAAKASPFLVLGPIIFAMALVVLVEWKYKWPSRFIRWTWSWVARGFNWFTSFFQETAAQKYEREMAEKAGKAAKEKRETTNKENPKTNGISHPQYQDGDLV